MTPDHTKQANAALSAASNRTMEVCKEVQQTRIKALAKQAGGTEIINGECLAFTPGELTEFVRLARAEVLEEADQAAPVPAYVPLTDKAIMKVWNTKVGTLDESGKWLLTYARAIERAVRGEK